MSDIKVLRVHEVAKEVSINVEKQRTLWATLALCAQGNGNTQQGRLRSSPSDRGKVLKM